MASGAARFFRMGLILDSTIPMKAERGGLNAQQAVLEIRLRFGDEQLAMSVITLTELAHGIARADSSKRTQARQQFLEDIRRALPIYPVSEAIAVRAGLLDGTLASQGIHVALSDLLIGVTALEIGYGVATHNVKHFKMIPGLYVAAL